MSLRERARQICLARFVSSNHIIFISAKSKFSFSRGDSHGVLLPTRHSCGGDYKNTVIASNFSQRYTAAVSINNR